MTLYQNAEMTPANFELPLLEGTKAVAIGISDIDAGWVNLKIKVGNKTHFIHASYVYDPFPQIRDLFTKVLDGFNYSMEIDEEGHSTIIWIDREPNSLTGRLMVWKPEDEESKPEYVIDATIDMAQFLHELFVRLTSFWDTNMENPVLMADWLSVDCDETTIDEDTHQKIKQYYKTVDLNNFSNSIYVISGHKNSINPDLSDFLNDMHDQYLERRKNYVPEDQTEIYMVFWETLVNQGNGSRGYFTAGINKPIKTVKEMENFVKELQKIVNQKALESKAVGIPAISNISKIK